jgi:hypothetical protein
LNPTLFATTPFEIPFTEPAHAAPMTCLAMTTFCTSDAPS